MGSTILTQFDTTTNRDLLKTGSLRKIHDNSAGEAKVFRKGMANDLTTKEMIVRDLRMAGFENAVEIGEGQNIPIYTPVLGTTKEYTQRDFGIGFRMSFKMDYFNKYGLWKKWAEDIGRAQTEGKDIEIHTLFNSPTSTSLACGVGFDTYALAANAHTGLLAGSTADNYDNLLSQALSTSALESVRYYFATLVNDMGRYMGAIPDTLFYHPTQWPTVREILGSDLRPHELSNTVNIFPEMGLKPYENPRLTSTTAWGVLAKNDKKYDVNVFTGMEPKTFEKDAPDNTLDKVFVSAQFFCYGFGDQRLYYQGNT